MRLAFLVFIILLSSCQSLKLATSKKKIKNKLEKEFFDQHFSGFALYDPVEREWLYQKNIKKYFTPASNVKILSLYAGLKMLSDSLPGIRYQISNDTLYFTGTGDPTFLHPDFLRQPVYHFLKRHQGVVVYVPTIIKSASYGPGWSWDDYQYDFQPERNGFPMYGNVVRIQYNGKIEAIPDNFTDDLILSETSSGSRYLDHNIFLVSSLSSQSREVPFRTYPELTVELLSDTLQRKVIIGERSFRGSVRNSHSANTLYSIMMKRSDNFYAEQLLMMCSSLLSDTLSVERAIAYVNSRYLSDLPDPVVWVDGSGLSRYNLVTPRTMVKLLDKLRMEKEDQWLFSIFPAGGQSGTIKSWYENGNQPYIYAKTGTLSNNHNLSGYLITANGRTLIFSFMNNNYTLSANEVKANMEDVLEIIRDNF